MPSSVGTFCAADDADIDVGPGGRVALRMKRSFLDRTRFKNRIHVTESC